MPVSDVNYRPYAAAANVQAVLERVRTRNMPDLIDAPFMRAAQVPEKSIGRVLDTLRFLHLVNQDDSPSDELKALAGAAEDQRRDILASIIRERYKGDFARIDPATDPQHVISDAFSPYAPKSQTKRMVMLFLGLCRYAGIEVMDAPRERSVSVPKAASSKLKPNGAKHVVSAGNVRPHSDTDMPSDSRRVAGGPDLLFGVTEHDIILLDDKDFDEVWAALGKVAKARSRAARAQMQEREPAEA